MIIGHTLYLMLHRSSPNNDYSYSWLGLNEAGHLFDSGLIDVRFGEWVIEPNSVPRPMVAEDKAKIADKADEISASK